MVEAHLDKRLLKTIKSFSAKDKARINKTVSLFREKGFFTDEVYLKKLTKRVWELKPGKVRLLFGLIRGTAVFVSIFVKKSQKTPLKEIRLAEKRLTEYI